MKKFNKKLLLPLLCAVALIAVLLFVPEDNGTYTPYAAFHALVGNGTVTEVTMGGDSLYYYVEDDTVLYRTENPDSSDLKEKMLLQGIKVQDSADAGDVFSLVTDILFYALFFGAVAFGAYKLLSYSRKTFRLVRHTGVRFSDIAGMAGPKKEILWLADVLKNPAAYRAKGVRQVKGVILEGPPGNGKTLFAKALAEEAGVNFLAAKGADFQSALMSVGPTKIKSLFAKAKRHKPCIVFIDEFDSIGERRNYAGTGIDKENNRIITTMLNAMDGFEGSDGILIIAATNSYASLDAALVRPGRFDLKYTIGNPDLATRMELIGIVTRQKTLAPEVSAEALAGATEGLSCAAIETLLNTAAANAGMEGRGEITAKDIAKAAADTKLHLKK